MNDSLTYSTLNTTHTHTHTHTLDYWPYLGRSRSGRSRGWSPRCPCVSAPRPQSRRGPRCLQLAGPAASGGASAPAPGTPAGTGSSSPPLQVSVRGEEGEGETEREREKDTLIKTGPKNV